jgi:thiol-disulfide isomerase/thioredoxin
MTVVTHRRRRLLLVPLVVALLLLAGCGGGGIHVGKPDVKLDTPELEKLKTDAGIPDCPETKPADGPVKGGLPDVTLPCLGGGRSVHLASLRGPMVINLWAQWCAPCRDEMPVLQAFAEKHPNVPLLGIDWEDTQPKRALELARDSYVGYPLVADLERRVKTSALPTTILLDKRGRIVFQEPMVIGRVLDLEALIRENLGLDLGLSKTNGSNK